MAKLLDKKSGKTVYTLELTEDELVLITSAVGVTSKRDRKESILYRLDGFEQLDDEKDGVLYDFLRETVIGIRKG